MIMLTKLNSCSQEIAANDTKIHETVEQINTLKTSREFYLSFADNPQEFITNWLISQTRDLKVLYPSCCVYWSVLVEWY